MRVCFTTLSLAVALSIAWAGCRSISEHEHPGLSATQIREKIVGAWTHVASSVDKPLTTLTFGSDGRLEFRSEGYPANQGYWRAEDRAVDTVVVTQKKSDIGGPGDCWTIWRLDDHNLIMFTGGLSAAGPPKRYNR